MVFARLSMRCNSAWLTVMLSAASKMSSFIARVCCRLILILVRLRNCSTNSPSTCF
ncbi:hypothetical protein PR003_g1724 [Phytophthora rubi]|uniref:Uncharacterized protein n=1 Tax=Phytophthora rubi TaxID=129364 RepID=A0A6A4G6X2_9STRA|nr:hypothetical protein PR002_g9364 [Phytophthora rubi]KAE9036077.1 hypothetical protein PR001_g9004 [Phytophthora rubi]KAE9357532.1 hypothetical protein PR003_g1724 [Phytophthora rubi]